MEDIIEHYPVFVKAGFREAGRLLACFYGCCPTRTRFSGRSYSIQECGKGRTDHQAKDWQLMSIRSRPLFEALHGIEHPARHGVHRDENDPVVHSKDAIQRCFPHVR